MSVVSVLPGVFGSLRSSKMGFRSDPRLLARDWGRVLWRSGELSPELLMRDVVDVLDWKVDVLGWFMRVRLMRMSLRVM